MSLRTAPSRAFAVLLIGIVGTASADDPAARPAPAVRVKERATTAPATTVLDPAATKLDAESRLKALETVPDKEMTNLQKSLRDLLTERLRWVDDWKKAVVALEAAAKPKPSPEEEALDRKAALERIQTLLNLAAKSPNALLPATFRLSPSQVDSAKLAEMRDAIEAAKTSHNERLTEFEKLRAEPNERVARLNGLRADRDKIQARIATIPPRRVERMAAVTSATDEDARSIARERLTNFAWESAVENERLLQAEATIALETRRAASTDAGLQAKGAGITLAKQTLKALTERYNIFTDRQKIEIDHAAKVEATRAATADDPVEKYLARRRAELFGLQGQILDDNKALSASQSISLEEQTSLANHVKADFESLKEVVKDNRAGGLIALRLNNDFRRISTERATIIRNELAQSTAANTYYENALTEAEIASINDARDDRFEREAFVETLPVTRRSSATAAIDELEVRHKALLTEHREVLQKLLTRAEKTHQQVARRLEILDEQYAFVRTNLFWVRDSEPIGPATLPQARRDAARLVATLIRLAAEPFDPALWSPVSVEFALATSGVMILPLVIWRVRKRLDSIVV